MLLPPGSLLVVRGTRLTKKKGRKGHVLYVEADAVPLDMDEVDEINGRMKKHYTEQFAKYDTYRKEHNLNGRQMAKVLGVKYADLRDCLIGTKIHGHVMTTIKEL